MLKSTRLGTGKINYNDSTLEVAATLSALDRLGDHMGCDPLEAVSILCTFDDDMPPLKVARNLATLLFGLQHGSNYSLDEIYDWLFGDWTRFGQNSESIMAQIATALQTMMGVDIGSQIPASDDTQKKDGN